MAENRIGKAKVVFTNRDTAKGIMGRLAAAFPDDATLSPLMLAQEGDFYFYVNFLGTGDEIRDWHELPPTPDQKATLFGLGLPIPPSRGEASDLLSKVLRKRRLGP